MIIKSVAKATVAALGLEEKVKVVASRTHLHRRRIVNREETAQLIKQEFNPGVPLVIHFDGKLLPSNEGSNLHLFVY
jgi:hypothetical protein